MNERSQKKNICIDLLLYISDYIINHKLSEQIH